MSCRPVGLYLWIKLKRRPPRCTHNFSDPALVYRSIGCRTASYQISLFLSSIPKIIGAKKMRFTFLKNLCRPVLDRGRGRIEAYENGKKSRAWSLPAINVTTITGTGVVTFITNDTYYYYYTRMSSRELAYMMYLCIRSMI